MADLAVWQRTIVDEEGNVIPGAEIEVRREEDDSLATLYADRAGETPLANPLAADMSGFVRFFAQGDAYTITAVGAGSTRTWRFDPTGRLQEFDRVSEALNTAGGADTLETRKQLGTFSSVAEVQSRHIPAVLESIRTFGRNVPGDGGDALLIEGESTDPGAIQDADGKWWKVAEKIVHPQMFGAKGDGSTSDQTALEAVVNFALLTGAEIHWTDNDFVSTGNIPGFHSVRHSGPGRILRGGEVWHVTPKGGQQNTYHVASNGDASQDGLSPSQPTTLSHVVRDIIPELGGKASCGQWAIHLLSGDYGGSSAVRVRDWPMFAQEVLVYGDMDGDLHLTVVDGEGANEAWWWRMASASVAIIRNIHFKDIHFRNWDPGGLGGALVASGPGGSVTETGCLFEDCYYGIWSQGPHNLSCYGRYVRCTIGVRLQYHGTLGVGSSTQRAEFVECGIGVDLGRNSAGSVGWADFYRCDIGVRGEQNSRTEVGEIYGEDWTNCLVYVRSGAVFNRQGSGLNYDPNSVTPSTPVIRYESGAIDPGEGPGAVASRHNLYLPSSPLVITGTTERQTLESLLGTGDGIPFRLPEYRYWTKGLKLTMELVGDISPSGGDYTLQLSGGAASAANVVAREDWPGDSSTFSWKVNVTIGDSEWLVESHLLKSFGSDLSKYRISRVSPPPIIGKGTGPHSMRLYLTAGISSGVLTVHKLESHISG